MKRKVKNNNIDLVYAELKGANLEYATLKAVPDIENEIRNAMNNINKKK